MNSNGDVRTDIGWGTPAKPAPASPTPTPPVPPSRPAVRDGWAGVRRALLWLVLVPGLAGVGLGLYLVAGDMAETGDMFHGLGIALGLALAVPCLVLCALAGFGLRAMRRRGADGGRPQAVATGLLLVAPLIFGVSSSSVGLSSFLLLPVVLGIALILSAVADRSERP